MTAHHWWVPPGSNTFEEITASVQIEKWQTKEQAEEGATPFMTLVVQDPGMVYDFSGHRPWEIRDDEITGDDLVYFGFISEQEISRGTGEYGEPIGRVWSLQLTDANTLWGRRVMLGSDAKRPDESDVERIQWLLATNEASEFEDVTTYVDTTDPSDMDEADLRGQMVNQIIDDCAQQSGKNWFCWVMWTGSAYEVLVWYGDDSSALFTSTLSISNDPDDWDDADLLDGTSLVWPHSFDAKMNRDPLRVFDKNIVEYDGGRESAVNTSTNAAFFDWRSGVVSHRDAVHQAPNVKKAATAQRRAQRLSRRSDDQDEVITTTVEVPAAIVNELRHGMLIPVKMTHVPGYDEFVDCRILSRQLQQTAAGDRYRVTLELQGPHGGGGNPPTPSPDAYAILYYAHRVTATGEIRFDGSGDDPPPGSAGAPTVGLLTPLFDAEKRPYYGIQVDGDGTIDVHFFASAAATYSGSRTFTWAITVNGGAVESESVLWTNVGIKYTKVQNNVSVAGLAVANGDIIGASLSVSPAAAFFVVPAGTGVGGEVLEITDGTLV